MSEYLIKGLHCSNCSSDLERKLNAAHSGGDISIDYDHQLLRIGEALPDLSAIQKVLEFEKITLVDVPETIENQKKAAHTHHHGMEALVQKETTKKIAIVFYLNLIFSVLEFFFGFMFNSLAIISDAVHDLGDAMSVGAAGYFQKLSSKEANDQYSFGHQRFSLLGAIVTAVVLLGGSLIVIFHSIPRVLSPQPVNYQGMFWLAVFAIAANGFSAWLMSRGGSHNESLINLHMMEDVLGWVGVLIVSILLHFTDWYFLDPLLSIGVALFILIKTWPLFKETVQIFLEATPKSVSKSAIEAALLDYDEITNCSHLHIWSIDGHEHALTVTLSTSESDSVTLETLKASVRKDFIQHNITHSTIEFVYDPASLLKKN
ncbi:MAG: cation transporter [Alkalibacterium sp.]|nr:cation transporter [Alkalibacterium sp.]